MSELLARLARNLTHHWKRSAVGAFLVARPASASPPARAVRPPTTSRRPAPRPSRRSISSRRTARRSRAPTRRSSSASRTARSPIRARRRAIQDALAKVKKLDGRRRRSATRSPRAARSRPTAGWRPSTCATPPTRATIEKPDGEALIAAGESAEENGVEFAARGMLIDLGSEQDAPVGELVGIFIAIILLDAPVPLAGGDGRDADRRADRRRRSARSLLVALAAPLGLPAFASVIASMLGLGAGIDYALLIIGRYREQVAARGQPPRRVGEVRRDLGRLGGRRRPGRDARDRRPARDRHPVHRQARPRGGDRRRRRRRLRADDPADHDRRASAAGWSPRSPSTCCPSPAFAPLGRDRHREAVALDRAPACSSCCSSPRPSPSCASASPTTATSPSRKLQRVAYDRLSEAFGPGSNGPFLLAVDIPKGDADNEAQLDEAPEGRRGDARHGRRSRPRRSARTARWRRSSPSRRPPRRTRRTSDLLERLREDVIPEARRRHAAEGLRRRQHGRLRGLLGQGRLAPAAVHRAS